MTVILEGLIGASLIIWLYALIFIRWQRGLCWLVAYVPFAGIVTVAANLWWPSLLFKDVLFLIPLYIAFFANLSLNQDSLAGFPKLVALLMAGLAILVAGQMANPGVANIMMALIGLKVWLLYLPLCLVAYAYVDSTDTVKSILRLLVGLSFVPITVALGEVCLVHYAGYRNAMSMIYGAAADSVTQGFTHFQIQGGQFGRIPSTFTFVTQFFGYSLAMLAPAYVVWRTDPSPRWRRLGVCAVLGASLGTFVSGAREAYIFTPLALVLMFGLDRGWRGLIAAAGGTAVSIWAVVAGVFSITVWQMYGLIGSLFTNYAREAAYGGLVKAAILAPLGMGTGTNTGPARFAFGDPSAFNGIENYYAKALYELGIPGLLIVAGLFLVLIVRGFKARSSLAHPALRCCDNALVGFLIILFLNCFKGWQLDLDPVNVYYWLFAGILLKLPVLERHLSIKKPSREWILLRPAGAWYGT